MSYIDQVKERVRGNLRTIVLPETEDCRILSACSQAISEGIAKLVLVGERDIVTKNAKECGADISGATIVDPNSCDKFEEYAQLLFELRKAKGMTIEKAREILIKDYLTFGVVMVKAGDADGMVAGACHATADVLRPSLQILKTAPGSKLVSGFFIMDIPNCEFGNNGTLIFADCGLNQDPNPEELAGIAASSAASYKALVGDNPTIAMLSHSTKGSAKHDLVDKMVEATRIANRDYPDLNIDGELQADAALVPSIGSSKAPGSSVAGKANVLVFPNLDSGNIAYKLVQRLAKAEAYGPMLQGISKPVNDLSRGCEVEDIVGVIAITAAQVE